ncbi:hypothetical protein [Herbidospora mongoliensis]|uniref:hypothetical protein n=1 Tax=Herbidospora mongoliensis TaxID=688067 RepID=UPI00082BCEC6|nr:hypothetical protein [Herbidospora mongoliensis]
MAEQQVATARERLAQLMDYRRRALGLDWNQVAELAGLTKEGLRTIRGTTRAIRPKSARGIERALQWPVGAVDEILTDYVSADLFRAPADRPIATPPPQHPQMAPSVDSGVDALIQLDDGRTWAIQAKRTSPGSPLEDQLAEALEGAGFEIRQVVATSPLLDHGADIAKIRGLWLAEDLETPTQPQQRAGRAGRREQLAEDVTAEDILDDPDLPPRVRQALLDAYHRLRREVVEELSKPDS